MHRFKRIFILLGVLVVACVAAFAVTRYQEREEQIRASGETVLAIPADSVTALSWTYEGESFAFHQDGGWVYDGDSAFPVDEEKISDLLAQFEDLSAAFIIEDVEDAAQYGLDEPECTITLTADGAEHTIALGTYSALDEQRYADLGDGSVYLLTHDPLEEFDATLPDLIRNDETPAFTSVSAIRFSGAVEYTIAYDEAGDSYRAEDVYYAELDSGALPLDPDYVEDYLYTISSLDLTDYVTYSATAEELTDCGMDDPALTVAVDYDDGTGEETFVLNIGHTADEDGDNAASYVRVGDSPIVYSLTDTLYDSLMDAFWDDLRHREIFPADFADVAELTATLDGESYVLTAQEGGDGTWTYGDEEIEIADLQTALEDLSAEDAESFTTESPTGKEEIRLVARLDNEEASTVTVSLTRYDGTYCLAAVDGTSVTLVPRSQVVSLVEAVNAIVLG